MTQQTPFVKAGAGKLLRWIDHHPRTGWYMVLLTALTLAMHLAGASDVDPFWFAR